MLRARAISIAACLAAPVALLAQATLTGTLQVRRGNDLFAFQDCVVFASSDANGPLVAEYSDDKGRFELAFPPDTRVGVAADCPGYRLISIDGRRSALSRYDCSEPGPCAQVDLVIEPLAVVEGHVLGPNGMPVESVRLGINTPGAGRRGRHLQALSDDRGYFRFFHVPPGVYELVAVSRTGLMRGVEWIAEPQRIELAPGDVVSGVEVRMRAVESAPFTGQIEGLPPGTTQVYLQYTGEQGGVRRGMGRTVEVDEQGRFRIEQFMPGQYDFEMSLPNEDGNYDDASRVHIGSVDFTSSTGEAVFSRGRPIVVTGSLEVHLPERDDLRASFEGNPLFLNLWRDDGFRAGARAEPPDYRFQVPGLRPGRYRLEISGPGGAMVERRVGENEWAPLDEIAVEEGDTLELELRVRFEVGRLTVAVRPANRHYVVGIRKNEVTRLFPTDQNGRLVLDYFPVGDYRICAWPDISPEDANDPETWRTAGDSVRAFRHDQGVDMEITLTAAP